MNSSLQKLHWISSEDIKIALARKNFYEFFKLLNPKLKNSWWQEIAAQELQKFYEDYKKNLRPKLCIEAPPQHGKSELAVHFIAWVCGKDSDTRAFYASFSERLGVRANLKLQRIFVSEIFKKIFCTRIKENASEKLSRTTSALDFKNSIGFFRNTTILGEITGESADLGVIDDPLKGRKAANSKAIRDTTWEWFTDDFFSRFSDEAGFLTIMTRWHLDDPIGRLVEKFPEIKVLKFPAIADADALLMPCDLRKKGSNEPLFPAHKPLEFLLERKTLMGAARWSSLYQCNPVVVGGTFFKTENFKIVSAVPASDSKAVRYWDKAGTEDGGCFTAGVKMQKSKDGKWLVLDVVKGQLSALQREKMILQTAQLDGPSVEIWIEQEPGSGGKESAENSIRNLAGFKVKVEKVSGDKILRAESYAAQIEAGNVELLVGEWNKSFIEEHSYAPHGALKDQWDAAAGAFNKLAGRRYNLDNL